ncbi:multiple inositol polyphosphate phosphatase 1-like [Olea europaea subsp. europaea]|uniref:Multiple inositol polyphosphate phosphatase 1 n=1 Tax=Olea europaea subsp. europaea TaxID=158383 RepID=A0A8S0T202_OLEEU|nr:multiple inositol polyphosphate phosphatase 1-like [Olea europaea subsp. europaea]
MSFQKPSLLIFLFFIVKINSNAEENFDVRQHLCTVTRYHVAKDISENSFVPSNINDQCTPIHLNLVARHGTRAPTKKKLKQLEALSTRLQFLLQNVEEEKKSLHNIPAWLSGWKSPWKGKHKGGELISEGEAEMYELGIRIREKFPELFKEEYHPDIYPIKTTQISRASASAVAFGMGLFSGRGNLGLGRHRAFAVTSESRASDIMLRFHDCCQNYKAFRKSQEPFVDKLNKPLLNEIAQELAKRWSLNFTTQDISSLWFLCKQEASLLNTTDRACALFSPSQVDLLEWADDLELFILKGYGNSLNYRMGVPLLEDVIQSMEKAINAREGLVPGSYEMARLRFAHAETLLPFSCLIGLFLDGSEFELILREHPLQLPPKPPQKRIWHGSTVAPFAGNNMLVLYSCPDNNSSKYFVQVLHNEHPIRLPGCENSDVCPFEVFKERIAAPHLKHDYTALCNMESDQTEQTASRFLLTGYSLSKITSYTTVVGAICTLFLAYLFIAFVKF